MWDSTVSGLKHSTFGACWKLNGANPRIPMRSRASAHPVIVATPEEDRIAPHLTLESPSIYAQACKSSFANMYKAEGGGELMHCVGSPSVNGNHTDVVVHLNVFICTRKVLWQKLHAIANSNLDIFACYPRTLQGLLRDLNRFLELRTDLLKPSQGLARAFGSFLKCFLAIFLRILECLAFRQPFTSVFLEGV